jgi:hypothetical protein
MPRLLSKISRLQKNKWRDENSEPRRLKPAWFWTAGGTTEVVPFHKAFPKAASPSCQNPALFAGGQSHAHPP